MSTIRVGLIRCDTHGAYYGPLMEPHDPARFRVPMSWDRPYRHDWQHGGLHYYFYQRYGYPKQMTVPFVEGFKLVKIWDEDREVARMLADVFLDPPQVCEHFEQVSDEVDLVFIADCDKEGHDHLALARPGLEKGVATFVDKPFAYTIQDVRAIQALAQAHGAPVTSMSILRMLPKAALFARRLDEVGALQFGAVFGGNETLAGQIHAISLAQAVFGSGVQRVWSTGPIPLHTVHLDYGDREDRPPAGVTLNTQVGRSYHCGAYAAAFGPQGAIQSPPLSDFDYPYGAVEILRAVRSMVRTGRVPPVTEDMVEAVAVAQAARLAHQTGMPVLVEEILNASPPSAG